MRNAKREERKRGSERPLSVSEEHLQNWSLSFIASLSFSLFLSSLESAAMHRARQHRRRIYQHREFNPSTPTPSR